MIGYKKVYGPRRDNKFHGSMRPEYVLKVKTLGRVVNPKELDLKMRTSKVKVLEAYSVRRDRAFGKRRIDRKLSPKTKARFMSGYIINHYGYCSSFDYYIGKEAIADRLDTDTSVVCGHGIHFFKSKKVAAEYNIL